MNRVYDPTQKRLIYFGMKSTKDFWDTHWDQADVKGQITSVHKTSFVYRITKAYLPSGGRVLDGGCGLGQFVYAFDRWGYDAYGVDYAPDTVQAVKRAAPHLSVVEADVRALPFEYIFFDGYWSFGVIEHFWDGYDDIVREMKRVVRKGGYVFVTFPYMSPLRRFLARRCVYALRDSRQEKEMKDTFYQFALDLNFVKQIFEQYGFVMKECSFRDGVKGLKDEVGWIRPLLQPVYESHRAVARIVRYFLDIFLRRWSGHIAVCVFCLEQK